MSERENVFQKHPVHATLKSLEKVLDGLDVDKFEQPAAESIARFRRVVAHIKTRLSLADPDLTPKTALDNLNGQIPTAVQEITNFKNNNNLGHLTNATNHLDSALTSMLQLTSAPDERAESALLQVVEHFQTQSEEIIKTVESHLSSYDSQLKSVTDAAEKATAQLGELSAQIKSEKTRVDGVIAEFQKTSQEREDSRTNKFTESLSGMNDRFDSLEQEIGDRVVAIEQEFNAHTDREEERFKGQADLVIQELEALRKKASDLVHVIGNIGVTGNYQQTANKDESAANRYRWGAVLAFFAMAGIVIRTAFVINDIGWQGVAFRFGAALILAIPAFYMARESTRHREAAMRNRRIELELASLEPFIETLEADKKATIKQDLTKLYFGQKDEIKMDKDALPAGPLTDIIKLLLQWKGGK